EAEVEERVVELPEDPEEPEVRAGLANRGRAVGLGRVGAGDREVGDTPVDLHLEVPVGEVAAIRLGGDGREFDAGPGAVGELGGELPGALGDGRVEAAPRMHGV